MRKKYVAGNWKMNTSVEEGLVLLQQILNLPISTEAQIIVCPPFIHLSELLNITEPIGFIALGAQNCASSTNGAFTGEVSVDMLKDYVEYVIIGHSERRMYFQESNDVLKKKIDLVIKQQLKPIFCCGEPLNIREEKNHIPYVLSQIEECLFHFDHIDIEKIIIAYEPIWAIGTGVTAGPEEAQEMHHAIRMGLEKRYSNETSDNVSIIYGGSCNGANANILFSQPDIDGGLIGGASLNAADFVKIIQSF